MSPPAEHTRGPTVKKKQLKKAVKKIERLASDSVSKAHIGFCARRLYGVAGHRFGKTRAFSALSGAAGGFANIAPAARAVAHLLANLMVSDSFTYANIHGGTS
jgi:hypothetical protein